MYKKLQKPGHCFAVKNVQRRGPRGLGEWVCPGFLHCGVCRDGVVVSPVD